MAEEAFRKLIQYAERVESGLVAFSTHEFASLYEEYVSRLPEHLRESYIIILVAGEAVVSKRSELPKLLRERADVARQIIRDLARYREVEEWTKSVLGKLGW